MRINRYIAAATGMSRRAADAVIAAERVRVNDMPATTGMHVAANDHVTLDGTSIAPPQHTTTIALHKPVGYVCSRDGQGSKTIYDLLPEDLHRLKPVGRLDKNSSGLLLMTNDGTLAEQLTHPRYHKQKIYEIQLDAPLAPLHRQMISDHGIMLEDGLSKFEIERMQADSDTQWRVIMHEGRNRQIRRTFDALGYTVTELHRTTFGTYKLAEIEPGAYTTIA